MPFTTPARPSILHRLNPFVAVLLLALVACGGGDNSTGVSSTGVSSTEAVLGTGRAQALASGASPSVTVEATTIIIRGYTTMADNTGSYVKLRYNGRVIAADELRSTTQTDFVFRVATVIDGGTLDVVFTNATYSSGVEARQLVVQSLLVNGTAFSPSGPGVMYDTGHDAEAFDGIAVIPGTNVLHYTGALRFPMPAATALGAMTVTDTSTLSAPAGLFVDAWGGSDTYTGTNGRPFRSLARAAQTVMLTGENLYLRCGGVWRETLSLAVANMADGTQVLPYGNCVGEPKPVITGGESLNGGWQRNGNVWSRAVPTNLPKIRRITLAYTAMRTAQWPNVQVAMAQAVSAPSTTQIALGTSDATALAGRDLAGARIVLRTQPWRVEERLVNAVSGGAQTLTLNSETDSPLAAGTPWRLADKAWMLDEAGEFFHDVAAGRVYMIAPNDYAAADLNGLNIEGSVRDVALELRDRRNLVVRGIAFRMTRGDGLRLTDVPDAVVTDIEATDNVNAGVRLSQWATLPSDATGPRVENSLFAGNGEFGIDARYVAGAKLTGNRVIDVGVADYIGPVQAGIAGGAGAQILNNVVDRVGYAAITFSSFDGSLVANNEVTNYCLRLADCGAIYTWSDRSWISTRQQAVVEGNRIQTGRPPTSGSTDWGHDLVAGIYLDDFTRGVTVRNNFLHALPVGIYVHNGANNTVSGNRIWMANYAAIAVAMDRYDGDWSFGNLVQENEIVPYTETSGSYPAVPTFRSSHAFWFLHATAGEAALGVGRNEFRNNRVVQIHGEAAQHARVSGPSGERFIEAAIWQQLNPTEAAIRQPIVFDSYWAALGPEKVPGGEFDAGLGSWGKHWSWAAPGYDVTDVLLAQGCNGPCVRLTSAVPGDMIFSPPFSMATNKLHMYRFNANSTGAAATVGWPYLYRNGPPYDEMQDSRGFQGRSTLNVKAGQSMRWEGFFVPKSGDPARVALQLQTQLVPVNFDAVSIREVQIWLASGPSEWVATVIAERTAARNVASCGDVGLPANCQVADIDGSAVAFPFTVAAGQQRLLLWANSPYRRN